MNIALLGYGKMGKAIEEIALQKGHQIVLRIDDQNLEELTKENLRKADVAIEFTGPDSAVSNILLCFDAGIPVVCGTTGWLSQMNTVKQKCEEINASFLYASNFSIGVNIFFELNKKLAMLMKQQPNYDVSIEEIHHTGKKDAPSGTAITLAEQIITASAEKNKWALRQAQDGKGIRQVQDDKASNELVITSKRIDPFAGTHSVKYTSGIDDIEIIHTAHNRKGFAVGALLAAEFIHDKKGIYSMKDVLDF
ncbi:MAG: 4-hydroxy-tetrahydrodipicolinate reductase [Ginsengibacter sp.]